MPVFATGEWRCTWPGLASGTHATGNGLTTRTSNWSESKRQRQRQRQRPVGPGLGTVAAVATAGGWTAEDRPGGLGLGHSLSNVGCVGFCFD